MLAGPYLGTVGLGDNLIAAVLVETSAGTPSDPPTPPLYRAYSSTGLMPNGTGSLSKLDTASISAATNASPIQITATAHGYNTGTRINVSGVQGNTSANTETTVTVIDANNFTLDGTSGNGAYTGGGQAHVAGLYQINLSISAGNGFESGFTYELLVEWTNGGVNYAMLCTFSVI